MIVSYPISWKAKKFLTLGFQDWWWANPIMAGMGSWTYIGLVPKLVGGFGIKIGMGSSTYIGLISKLVGGFGIIIGGGGWGGGVVQALVGNFTILE